MGLIFNVFHGIPAILSILCEISLISAVILDPRPTLNVKMVAFAAGSNSLFAVKTVLQSATYLVGLDKHSGGASWWYKTGTPQELCVGLMWTGSLGMMSSITWDFIMVFNLLLIIQYPVKYFVWARKPVLLLVYTAVVFLLSSLFCVGGYLSGGFLPTPDAKCYMTGLWLDAFLILGIVFAFLGFLVVALCLFNFSRGPLSLQDKKLQSAIEQMVTFVIATPCCWGYPTVYMLLFDFNKPVVSQTLSSEPVKMLLCSALSLGFVGCVNFMVWRTRVFRVADKFQRQPPTTPTPATAGGRQGRARIALSNLSDYMPLPEAPGPSRGSGEWAQLEGHSLFASLRTSDLHEGYTQASEEPLDFA